MLGLVMPMYIAEFEIEKSRKLLMVRTILSYATEVLREKLENFPISAEFNEQVLPVVLKILQSPIDNDNNKWYTCCMLS